MTEYVTVQQIKSLFSRMSSMKRKVTLEEPSSTDKETVEIMEGQTNDDNSHTDMITNTASSVLYEF